MRLRSDDFQDMQPLPDACAFARPASGNPPVQWAGNRNPHLAWDQVPSGTRSFALTCIDLDAPSRPDDVNRPDRRIPALLARTDFVHWLVADLAADSRELAQASCSAGVVERGKRDPSGPPGAHQGRNDYGGWFAGDPAMAGDYLGYDGPCPPWNDERIHHYRFRLHALDIERSGLAAGFTLAELDAAIRPHVLAQADLTGTYTLTAALRR